MQCNSAFEDLRQFAGVDHLTLTAGPAPRDDGFSRCLVDVATWVTLLRGAE